MAINTFSEVEKIWDKFTTVKSWKEFNLDLDIQKKLFHFSQPGKFYYWILNSKTKTLEYVSSEAQDVLGYPVENLTLEFFFSLFHPDDIAGFLNFESAISDFFTQLPNEKRFSYKIQYDFRFKKSDDND